MHRGVIGQHIMGIIYSSYAMAKHFISSDPSIIHLYKTIPFYLGIAFQKPGHIAWNNKHWSYHWKESFLALPAKLLLWGNVCRQDAPPFPSHWPPSQQLSGDKGPPWVLWLLFRWPLKSWLVHLRASKIFHRFFVTTRILDYFLLCTNIIAV